MRRVDGRVRRTGYSATGTMVLRVDAGQMVRAGLQHGEEHVTVVRTADLDALESERDALRVMVEKMRTAAEVTNLAVREGVPITGADLAATVLRVMGPRS